MRAHWDRTPPLSMEEAADCRALAINAGDHDPEASHVDMDMVVEDAILAISKDFDDSLARVKVAMAADLIARAAEWRRWYA